MERSDYSNLQDEARKIVSENEEVVVEARDGVAAVTIILYFSPSLFPSPIVLADGPLYDYTAYTQNSDHKEISITVASASLQPFTKEQWSFQQQYKINTERKRAVMIHVSDKQGERLQGAAVRVEQVSKDFPFGSAINNNIIGNLPYQSHFSVPNLPLMRAILDKFATLELPIWLTEVDILDKFDHDQQATYLEEVLREGYSHPSVNGIMLWSALSGKGKCFRMCLADANFNNLPAGDTVDKLLKEWQTGVIKSQTDEHGTFSFYGYLGEYKITASFEGKTTSSTFSVSRSDETRHFSVQI
ncbi:hypothetical protein L1987_48843 [Smallanthus sonchifolius]|uniref:Uncharacterized protein n=1 Tax=Smallanthus sonchifolius TaxID=185202 RepID=A0ACB9FSF6_9ASTR|nr:hypothetical protein L1987_48843 [Smallanthus sonchifolius]